MRHHLNPIRLTVFFVVCVLGGSAVTGAMTPAYAAEAPKVAILDVDRILRVSKAAKTLREKIDQQRSVFQGELRKQEEDLHAADQELARQRSILSTEAFANKRKELQEQLTNLQRDFLARQKELEQIFGTGMSQVRRALVEVSAEIATEREFDIILLKATVVLVSRDLDITDEALSRLDAKLPSVDLSKTQN